MQTDINLYIADAAAEVLESMCFTGIDRIIPEILSPELDWLSAKLQFNGLLSGELGIGAPLPTARNLAAAFLGEDEAGLDLYQSSEFLGELSNMICGSVLGRLRDGGIYKLSHPTTGPFVLASQPGSTGQIFQLDQGELYIWMIVEEPA